MERNCLSSIGSLFQAWRAATEKALSPNLQLICGTVKSPADFILTYTVPTKQDEILQMLIYTLTFQMQINKLSLKYLINL